MVHQSNGFHDSQLTKPAVRDPQQGANFSPLFADKLRPRLSKQLILLDF